MTADLSVVVISHGHEAFVKRCLESFEPALENVRAEVLLIDNLGSGKLAGAVPKLRQPVTLHNNTQRLGFAGNCNEAFRLTRAPYVLLLNPDTEWQSGSVAGAISFMESRPDAGILGCKLVDDGGREQESYRRFPNAMVFAARVLGAERWPWQPAFYREAMMEGQRPRATAEVDLVTGAFFLVRRSCFEKIGGFDESFFMYYEDADFCYRARQAGMRTFFYPAITVLHQHQRSSRDLTSPHARWHMQSALRYFRKHRSAPQPEIANWTQH